MDRPINWQKLALDEDLHAALSDTEASPIAERIEVYRRSLVRNYAMDEQERCFRIGFCAAAEYVVEAVGEMANKDSQDAFEGEPGQPVSPAFRRQPRTMRRGREG